MTRHGKAINTSSKGEGPSHSTRLTDSITTGTTQQSGESQDEGGNTFAGQAVEQMEALVESFRTGKVKKSQTIFKIGQILAAEPTGDEQLKSDALEQYASTLDGIEALAAQSVEHGKRFTDPLLKKRKDIHDDGSR